MKMSKILSLILAVVMIASTLMACNKPETPETPDAGAADLAGTYDITMWVSELDGVKEMTQEMIDTCPVDRVETLADYKKQMDIVNEFAPSLITDETEIKTIVSNLAAQNSIELVKSSRGAIMKIVSANLKGKADMSIVRKVVGGMLH